jgi:predicted Ser/Thr protein kinase
MSTTQRTEAHDLAAVRAALDADYEVIQELGRGGMAVVYRGRERALGRDVAIKVLPLGRSHDDELIERFQREARTAAQLEHPHIVPIHRVGRMGDVSFIVMKLLRGQSLAAHIRKQGRLPAVEIRRVLLETASALGYAAQHGIVHRDVKPDNIVLDHDGRCVVTDFGIARSATESKLTAEGTSVGTPRYMSPEQARAQEVDGRSDIYSLGVVAYECLVGVPPFDSGDMFAVLLAHIQSPVPRPKLRTSEDRALYAVIERMLAKRPEERFQTAQALIAALGGGNDTGAATVVVSPASLPGAPTGKAPRRGGTARLETTEHLTTDSPEHELAALANDGLTLDAALVSRRKEEASRSRSIVRRAGRFVRKLAVAGIALVASYYAIHFGVKHRSRCPQPASAAGKASADPVAPSPASSTAPSTSPRAFTLLVDAIGANRQGTNLDVYYDVCGLEDGATFTTHVSVSRSTSGLKRLLGGGVQPIALSYDEKAGGPAVRRHRTISFGDMPAGSYSLDVVVLDEKGRRRERVVEFQVPGS